MKHETPKTYIDQVEEVNPDGSRIEKLVEREYPITPEYVASFEESCNYKNDPQGAIARAPSRENLGDVSMFQHIAQSDSAEVQEFVARAQAQYKTLLAKAQSASEKEKKEDKEEN
ncbi:hypothetical protein [Dipodfec virus UA06Rod_16]|uniref:Uncharacterized protein n=1 Tax=Dipodfec virus UA06Rod_16 TaxID=2929317 RepID=A0A976R749_9VIRU|nr:hypothetical protein [Dipodfec virus UA06Rod_16]